MKPPFFPTSPDDDEKKRSRRPVNVSTSTAVPSLTPNSAQGGKGKGEMSLENAQLYVNNNFPQTTQKADPKTLADLQKLTDDVRRLEGGEVRTREEAHAINQAYRDRMAFYEGQMDALRESGKIQQGDQSFPVDADVRSEYKAWQDGHTMVMTAVLEERYQERIRHEESNIKTISSNQPIAVPTDALAKAGDKAEVVSYLHDGTKLTNSYRLENDRVIHTNPQGYEKTYSVAESRVLQADHAAAVHRNTANLVATMKADPSRTVKQGDFTYSVRGESLVRTDAQGKEAFMPMAKFEANVVDRGAKIAAAQKEARTELMHDNKERAQIKAMLEKKASAGQFAEHETFDKHRNPTTWKLDDKGELRAEKGQRSTDLNKATNTFAAKLEAFEDAKAFSGQKTIVGRLREKGEGATLTNKATGDTYRLEGNQLHSTRKDGVERKPVDAEKSHVMQERMNTARAAEAEEKKQAK